MASEDRAVESDVSELIPDEGGHPVSFIRVLSYIGADGTMRHAFKMEGENDATHILGLLRIVEHELLTEYWTGNDEP